MLRTALILARCNSSGFGTSIRDILCLPAELMGPALDVPLDLSSLDNLRLAVRVYALPVKDLDDWYAID